MPAVLTPPEVSTAPIIPMPPETLVAPVPVSEQRFVLPDVSWATYEQLLANYENSGSPRFTYLQGDLEIIMPSRQHEENSETFKQFVQTVCEERDLDFRGLGSTTYKREDLLGGAEPDGCFYIQNVARIVGASNLDLAIHPPPDLVIEIDLTSPSVNKFSIYAALGVPEIWHHQNGQTKIYALREGAYQEAAASQTLTGVTGAVLDQFLAASRDTRRPAWLRSVREWAQETASA